MSNVILWPFSRAEAQCQYALYWVRHLASFSMVADPDVVVVGGAV
jgi:hypothetical protein